jgi:Mn-containing catalase
VYERLINFCDDPGTKDALQFLMTREITHMKAFMAALDSMGKDALEIGKIPPTPGLVDQYFNDSTGEGDDGEVDARGPWNEGDDWEFVEAPAFNGGVKATTRKLARSSNSGPAKKRTSK